jgi:Phosphotransferase enzyme family
VTITKALPVLPPAEARPCPDRQPAEATGADPIEPLVPGPASRLANSGPEPPAAAAETAIRESSSLRDLFTMTQSVAHVLRESSDELADRGLALRARSRELQDRVHALRKRHVGLRAGRLAHGLAQPVPGRNRPAEEQTGPGPGPGRRAAILTLVSRGPSEGAENTTTFSRYLSADPGETEVPLLGGDMTEGVVRVGRTVRRPLRPYTPTVHALLRHLEAVGFDGAPRVLGVDGRDREVLTYLPGFTGRRSLPNFAVADSTLADLAELLLRYHEAVIDFEPPPWAQWDGELTRFVDGPADIICHCDVNLENVIFRTGPDGARPYAFIDFDLARPGTRLVDIIQTLRYWAPIADPADRDPSFAATHAPARIALFCEAYGLSYAARSRLVPVARRWLRRSQASIAERARVRGGAWARMQEAGVGERLLRSAIWLERNRPEIDARLRRPARSRPLTSQRRPPANQG